MRPSCLLVDDNGLFLDAAKALLEREGIGVVGVASTVDDALRQVQALKPDVILADIMLGEESGFDLARRLSEGHRNGGAAVILISTHAEAEFSALIDESPVVGFIPKQELSALAIRRALGDRDPG
jgi:DNA-binding NarL/FixJ family response regulator